MTVTPQTTHPYTFLIVGYGNSLRGDDGVGPQVAMAVSDWQMPSVKALSVQQLLPEMAVDMAAANYVIFVDAGSKIGASTLCLEPIVTPPAPLAHDATPALNHGCDPAALVALTQLLYGAHPQTWLMQIPTEHYDLGRALSETAQQGVASALRTIEQFLTTYLRPVFNPVEPCTKSA